MLRRDPRDEAARIFADPDELADYEVGLLDVPEAVAAALDERLAEREHTARRRQRAAALQRYAESGSSSLIARLRHARGWSQRDLARASATSHMTVWRAERSPRSVGHNSLIRIARALGVRASDLG